MLVKRLKKVLPLIIDNTQAAFVEGRQILDAILAATKAMGDHKLRKKKGPFTEAKLNLEKAYKR